MKMLNVRSWIAILSLGTALGLVAFRSLVLLPLKQDDLLKSASGRDTLDFVKMQKTARAFRATPPTLTETEKQRAKLGRALFFDTDGRAHV